MAMNLVVPDYVERKGSLTLRADHMNYSRGVLNSNWNQAREGEPKDYDMNRHPVRNLKWATYNRIGNITDGSLPTTTMQDLCNDLKLKEDFSEKDKHRSMITPETYKSVNLDRDTGRPRTGYGAVLPTYGPDKFKMYLNSSYKTDYVPQYPYTAVPEKEEEKLLGPECTQANKKCHSQFTDTTDYRRPGRNTWVDESGHYANAHHKVECGYYRPTGIGL